MQHDLPLLRQAYPSSDGEPRTWEDRGDHLYRTREDYGGGWRYVLVEPECAKPQPVDLRGLFAGEPPAPVSPIETIPAAVASASASEEIHRFPGMEDHLRRKLQRDIEHQRLPTCVVPDCDHKAPYRFTAAERGRLAGRDWAPGEEIRTCPEHGYDIYRAQGVYGRSELPEWLSPDAKLDELDAYDASYDTLRGWEIEEARARMLRVRAEARG